jgi:hypothetical protein
MSNSKVNIVHEELTRMAAISISNVAGKGGRRKEAFGLSTWDILNLLKDNPSLILMFYSQILEKKPVKTKVRRRYQMIDT